MLPLVYHPHYSPSFPENHRFVMSKFVRLHDYVQSIGLVGSNNLFEPKAATFNELCLAHDKDYLSGATHHSLDPKAWRRIGLPWSEGLIQRTYLAPQGTLLSARLALKHGLASHLAGGTHHSHRDFGSGFCILNDLAYTALSLLHHGEAERVLIFDLDVHQGDGTATILQTSQHVYTCSIHCEKNFPFRKAKSDLDIGIEVGIKDQHYLELVEETIHQLLDKLEPDIVLYDAGIDIWENDALGKLCISWEGLHERDDIVLQACINRHIPVCTVIGGGYDKDHEHLARRHGIVVERAARLYQQLLS